MIITIQEKGEKETEVYKIVGTTEADILAEVPKISNESQVGKALLGKKKWESFELKNGGGQTVQYTIIDVA